MAVLLTRSPPATTLGACVTEKLSAAPARSRVSTFPSRRRAKRKSSPMISSRTFIVCTRSRRTKVAASISRIVESKRGQKKMSTPNCASASNFSRNRISLAGGLSPAKNSLGVGSKLITTVGIPDFSAESNAPFKSFWCPRCRPSKAPIVATLPPATRSNGNDCGFRTSNMTPNRIRRVEAWRDAARARAMLRSRQRFPRKPGPSARQCVPLPTRGATSPAVLRWREGQKP